MELRKYKFQKIDYDKEIEKWKGKLIKILKSKEGISGRKKLCEEILQKMNWLEDEKKKSEDKIVSRFFRKNKSSHLVAGSQPAMISDSRSSSALKR